MASSMAYRLPGRLSGRLSRSFLHRPRLRHAMRQTLDVAAAFKDPYDLLGVDRRTATVADIKKAFRKRALRLHPDVNKAPDAKERFMEAKQAYQQLLDEAERREGRSSASGWTGASGGAGGRGSGTARTSSSTAGTGRRPTGTARPQQPEEEFYGFGILFGSAAKAVGAAAEAVGQAVSAARWRAGDLLRDLDKELSDYSRRRASRASASGEPQGLWDELRDIGEEFLDFLEQGLATDEEQEAFDSYKASSPGGSRKSSSSSSDTSQANMHARQSQHGSTGAGSASGSRAPSGSSSGSRSTPGSSTPMDSIEEELLALKRKMGKL